MPQVFLTFSVQPWACTRSPRSSQGEQPGPPCLHWESVWGWSLRGSARTTFPPFPSLPSLGAGSSSMECPGPGLAPSQAGSKARCASNGWPLSGGCSHPWPLSGGCLCPCPLSGSCSYPCPLSGSCSHPRSLSRYPSAPGRAAPEPCTAPLQPCMPCMPCPEPSTAPHLCMLVTHLAQFC